MTSARPHAPRLEPAIGAAHVNTSASSSSAVPNQNTESVGQTEKEQILAAMAKQLEPFAQLMAQMGNQVAQATNRIEKLERSRPSTPERANSPVQQPRAEMQTTLPKTTTRQK